MLFRVARDSDTEASAGPDVQSPAATVNTANVSAIMLTTTFVWLLLVLNTFNPLNESICNSSITVPVW